MNRHTAWRDLWLVLTVVTTTLTLAASALLAHALLDDPAYVLTLALRTDGLTRWPPSPDMEQLTLLAPPALAFLAWRFHRYYQDALDTPDASREDTGTDPDPTAPRDP